MIDAAAQTDATEPLRGDSFWTTWTRRIVTIPATFVMLALVLVTAPLWLPLAWIVDLTSRGRRAALPCGLFLVFYLVCEAAGILASGAIWVAALAGGQLGRPRYLDWNFALQRWWGSALLRGAQRVFGFRMEVEGARAVAHGPLVLLLRHASVADTVLAAEHVSKAHRVRLRYVIKRDLLWDPCLDIVGNRLPNCFVRRGAEDAEREIRGVQTLMHGMGDDEGVLIYPEGTRFTAEKRERVLERLRQRSGDRFLARAEGLRHTLPPRLGGTLALLDANTGCDVVFCAHTGFENVGTFWDLWNGALKRAHVQVAFWRVPFAEVPRERTARIDWLYTHWERIDAWIAAHHEPVERPSGVG